MIETYLVAISYSSCYINKRRQRAAKTTFVIIIVHRQQNKTRRSSESLQARNHKQNTHETDDGDQRINGQLHFTLRLERESSLTAHRASLILGPRALGPVVHVPTSLAHPQLSIHQVRFARRRFPRRRGRLLVESASPGSLNDDRSSSASRRRHRHTDRLFHRSHLLCVCVRNRVSLNFHGLDRGHVIVVRSKHFLQNEEKKRW